MAQARDTNPRNPAPIKSQLSLPDRVRLCCNSPSRLRPARTPPSFSTTFLKAQPAWCWPTTTQRPASGDFKIRVVNASPNLGPADVYIVTPGTDLNTVSPTLSNLAFGSAASYQSLAAGSYEVALTAAGQKLKAIDTGSISLSSGQVRTLVATNSQSGGFSYSLLQDVN